MTTMNGNGVGRCQDLSSFDTAALVSLSANVIGATSALPPAEYNTIVKRQCEQFGSTRRMDAVQIYKENWGLSRVLRGDYVMVPVIHKGMKINNPQDASIVYSDGTTHGSFSEKSFVITIAGATRRFDTADEVFKDMKAKLQSNNNPVKSETLLWYKKTVRGDTLSLIINRQLQFLGNQFSESIAGCLGDSVITSCDSALILGGYQNTNKSANKNEKITGRGIQTLKIMEKPANMETLFSRTKVAFDILASQKATATKFETRENVILQLRHAITWWTDPFLSKSVRECAFLDTDDGDIVSEEDDDA
jgi:hypothetical protein